MDPVTVSPLAFDSGSPSASSTLYGNSVSVGPMPNPPPCSCAAAETQAFWAALDNRITAILLHCATPMVIATHPRLVVAQQSVLESRATKINDASEREELRQLSDSLSEDDPV